MRKIGQGQIEVIRVIARVLLLYCIVLQTYSAFVVRRLFLNCIPDVIKVFGLVARVTDHDVVFDSLRAVGKAGFLFRSIVRNASPTVGLDTDGHVDLVHSQRAADIAHLVVTLSRACDDGVFGRYCCDTRINASIAGFVIGIRVFETDAAQRIAVSQAVNGHLVGQRCGHGQGRTVILLAQACSCYSDFLLIEESELQASSSNGIGDLVIGACGGAVVGRALDGLGQLPASNRRAGQREGLAHLQHLCVIADAGDGIAIHVDEMHRHIGVLEA